MALSCLLPSSEWDKPVFKVLANNDTGAAAGHQGGIVIPKDLRPFFPGLSAANTSMLAPTTDRRLMAELFVENRHLGTVSTRYQYQTWGGTRNPESRLTDELAPLRNLAKGGDILIVQRNMDRLDRYRLTLVRQSGSDFQVVKQATAGKRWGPLTSDHPLTQRDLDAAVAEEAGKEGVPFTMFDEAAQVVESSVKKIARSVAFRETVCRIYENTCAACGTALRSPTGSIELDAAHIVPRSRYGADDARNGLALCKRHHWAFDGGLFGISDDLKIVVPAHVSAISENQSLKSMIGQHVRLPTTSALIPNIDALRWHRHNIVLKSL